MDRLALVTLPGATLSYGGKNAVNCNTASTGEVASADEVCLIAAGAQKFLWIEGTFDGGTGTRHSDIAIWLCNGVNFSRIHSTTITSGDGTTSGWNFGVDIAANSISNSLTDLTVNPTGTGSANTIGIQLYGGSDYNTLANATANGYVASGSGYGIIIKSSHNSVTDITANGNSENGLIVGNGGSDNTFQQVTTNNNSAEGILVGGTSNSDNVFRNVYAANNGPDGTGSGIVIWSADALQLFDAVLENNHGAGLNVNSGTSDSIFNRINISGTTGGAGLTLNGGTGGNIYSQIVLANNAQGITIDGEDSSFFSEITITNSGTWGLQLENGADGHTFNQILIANSGTDGIGFGGTASADGTFGQLVSVQNSNDGVNLSNLSDSSKFTGSLLVGGNGSQDCTSTGGTDAGLVDGSCTSSGTDGSNTFTAGFASDAVLRTGRSVTNTFVGKLTTDDAVNTSDGSGSATYPATPSSFDWVDFSNLFRNWGLDGSAFPNADHQGPWTTGIGRIWDWQILSSDTTLLDRSADGFNVNSAFVNGITCPSAVDGNAVTVDQQSTAHTYLLNATEIVDPQATGYSATGNHNGLCESGENCIYAPNFGAYQGSGSVGQCTFSDGTITGVTMYAYTINGV
jgi:hypothetical protein